LAPDSGGGVSDFSNGQGLFAGGHGQLISADGRYTVFTSTARNLVAGQIDTNNTTDVFVYDRVMDTETLVSRSITSPVTAGDGSSYSPTISADGRYVAFLSNAQDLVAGFQDNNELPAFPLTPDLFLFDRVLGTTRLVSHSIAGPAAGGNGPLSGPNDPAPFAYISGHGEVVVYASTATDLVAEFVNPNINQQAYLFDSATGINILISHAASSATTADSSPGTVQGVSDDGQRVLYRSNNNAYVLDRPTGNTILISHKYGQPTVAANMSGGTAISADGTKVLFGSAATNIVPGYVDNNGPFASDYYLNDLVTGAVSLVTHSATSMTAGYNAGLDGIVLSGDGSTVVLATKSTNMVSGFISGKPNVDNIYAYDAATGNIVLVSRSTGTTTNGANDGSVSPCLSGDGHIVVFASSASDIVSGFVDGNGMQTGNMLVSYDVYAFDLTTGTPQLVSHTPIDALHGGNDRSWEPSISRDGTVTAFSSSASDLLSSQFDGNGQPDVFLFATGTGVVSLASKRGGAASISAGGHDNNNGSHWIQQSADGRFIVYPSTADNSVPGQMGSNGGENIFLYDRLLNTTQLVSHANGQPAKAANNESGGPVISADGRYVAYCSWATDLIAGFVDSNGPPVSNDYGADIFLFDRITGTNQLISRQAGTINVGGNQSSGTVLPDYLFTMSINDDGRFVSYVSNATDLISGYIEGNSFNQPLNIYVFDRMSGTNTLVSHGATSPNVSGDNRSYEPEISGAGRYIAYWGDSTSLVAGMPGVTSRNAFLYDQQYGTTTLVSHAYGSTNLGANGATDEAYVSHDGNYVFYESVANNLIAGATDANNVNDIFLYNVQTEANTLVSHTFDSPTTSGSSKSYFAIPDILPPTMSDDGRFIIYQSSANNLISGFTDNNGTTSNDIFLYDRITDVNVLVSHALGSTTSGSNQDSHYSSISGDGRFVAFSSQATNLAAGGNLSSPLIAEDYVYDALTGNVTLISRAPDGQRGNGGTGGAFYPWINGDGSVIAFAAGSDNLVPGDMNGFDDVFAYVTPPPQVASVQINDGSVQRSVVRSMTVSFDEPVFFSGDPAAAFTLTRNGSVGSVQLAVGSYTNSPNGVVTLTFSGPLTEFGSLMDGQYSLTIDASQVKNIANLDGTGAGVAGVNWVSSPGAIFRLFGDASGDGTVSASDFILFRLNFGGNANMFDFDGDGYVSASDFLQFRMRFGGSI
jgi:hypothetical protein